MRLYSFVSNERKITKQQGGNEELHITLLHETKAGSWHTSIKNIHIYFVWNSGIPFLSIELPENWKKWDFTPEQVGDNKDDYNKIIRAEYQPEENKGE